MKTVGAIVAGPWTQNGTECPDLAVRFYPILPSSKVGIKLVRRAAESALVMISERTPGHPRAKGWMPVFVEKHGGYESVRKILGIPADGRRPSARSRVDAAREASR